MLFSIFSSTLPPWLLFLLMFGGIIGLPCLALPLMRRHQKRLEEQRDEAEEEKIIKPVTQSVGLMYAVLLGLMILSANNKAGAADLGVSNEASAIMAAARDSVALPEPLRSQVQHQLTRYTELVISDDWPIMSGHIDNQKPLKASGELTRLWTLYGAQISRAPLGDSLMSNLNTISVQRTQRFALSREGIPDALWILLIVGTAIIIYLALLTRIKRIQDHLLMIILTCAPMAIFLWLIADMDNPFGGTFQISSSAFVHALQVLHAVAP
ncbi:MAG TPA: DUF4239 domain-containing protein [Ktedonosporobacter sp.]|nr:DUF4239 domain-containing protein [Ktedonosporobacter sp.]